MLLRLMLDFLGICKTLLIACILFYLVTINLISINTFCSVLRICIKTLLSSVVFLSLYNCLFSCFTLCATFYL